MIQEKTEKNYKGFNFSMLSGIGHKVYKRDISIIDSGLNQQKR